MPPAEAGSGHIFVANEGLTALATIMSPTFEGSEFRSPLARYRFDNFPICRGAPYHANASFITQTSKSETGPKSPDALQDCVLRRIVVSCPRYGKYIAYP